MTFFQSITSLFTGASSNGASSSRHATRRSVINSTFDAFSLPSTHTSVERYGDGMVGAHSAASSPGPSRRTSEVYSTYPPSKDAYRPSLTHFPPLSHTYHRIRKSLADSFPELLETLNAPVDPSLLASFEAELGCPLPPPVRDSFLIADGQDLQATTNIQGQGGLFFGLHLLPLEEVMREWAFWRQAEHDPTAGQNPAVLATMASVPPSWIKSLYACRGWLPLLSDQTGNYVGVDLDPGPGGAWGQVIVFGRDFDRKCVLWRGEGEGGWGKWLAAFVDELESGEGWEADKSNSSDEDEEVGYGSYNGGATYGEAGKGLRLAGEYRGWNVLEAWWDRSVRRWEGLGLGLDVEEIEKGLQEARRLSGLDANGKGKDSKGFDFGMGVGESATQVEIPVLGSPNIPPAPSTPVPGDSDVLLPPASPYQPPITKVHHPQPPIRVITPVNTSEHPLATDVGLLSPPGRSPSHHRLRPIAPSPTTLDLPTRADVQAMHAIARAETSGLRGGWVMNLDAGSRAYRRSMDNEMVDIDLESGQGEGSSSPRISVEEMTEPMRSPRLMSTRTPSPAEMTPRAPAQRAVLPSSVLAATTALRRPWPIPENPETATRAITTNDEWEGYKMESRSSGPGRTTRESSVMSTNSDKGLLDDQIYSHRSVSPTITMSPMDEDKSRPSMTPEGLGSATFQPEDENRDDSLDEVDLDGMEVGGGEPNGVMGKIATKNHNVLGRAGLRR